MHKLIRICRELQNRFMEREAEIMGLCLGLLAGKHVLFLGPPGTGKSKLVNEFCLRMTDGHYFSYLLNSFTRPDELIGSVSIKGLEADDYRRVLDGRIADAHIAFLDEVFHANSGCANSLLTIMNERKVHNGRTVVSVPLVMLVGASNQLPLGGKDGAGFYDRFLLRYRMDYIRNNEKLGKLMEITAQADTEHTTYSLGELALWQEDKERVLLTHPVKAKLLSLVQRLRQMGVTLSDRRIIEAIAILKSHAFLYQREVVLEEDFRVLKHVFWQQPDERNTVGETIHKLLTGPRQRAAALLLQAQKLATKISGVENRGRLQALGAELNLALTEIIEELAELCQTVVKDQDNFEQLLDYKLKAERVHSEVVTKCLGLGTEVE